MSINTKINEGLKSVPFIACILLAASMTTCSVMVAYSSGLQMAGEPDRKLTMAVICMLAVIAVHLLPSLCRQASVRSQVIGALIWVPCLLWVCYIQATFFLSTQQQAGMMRATAISPSSFMAEPKRNLVAVLTEQAKVKNELLTKSQLPCVDGCLALQIKLASLKNRLAVLNAEADDINRWLAEHDRNVLRQDAVRDEPVQVRLANWIHGTTDQMGLLFSLLFFVFLEGFGCYCWYLVPELHALTVTQPVVPIPTAVPAVTKVGNSAVIHPLPAVDRRVEELVREIQAGRFDLTVRAIRAYYHCSQKTASELRRLVAGKLNPEAEVC